MTDQYRRLSDGRWERSTPDHVRFWAKVRKTDGCWEWLGYVNPGGYGRYIDPEQKGWQAHRKAWVLTGRELIAGMELDHLCRNRSCVNPEHLEQVTKQENIRRGDGGRMWRLRTHCPSGHPYDDENTRIYQGRRYCIACNRESSRKRYSRRRSGAVAA